MGSLGGPLSAGVYCFTSGAQLTGTLTLTGDATSVFIFQIGSTLVTAGGSQVVLSGVNPDNVYWVEGTSATFAPFTLFEGNVLAKTAIVMNTGSSLLTGLALSATAVTLNDNAVTVPP